MALCRMHRRPCAVRSRERQIREAPCSVDLNHMTLEPSFLLAPLLRVSQPPRGPGEVLTGSGPSLGSWEAADVEPGSRVPRCPSVLFPFWSLPSHP